MINWWKNEVWRNISIFLGAILMFGVMAAAVNLANKNIEDLKKKECRDELITVAENTTFCVDEYLRDKFSQLAMLEDMLKNGKYDISDTLKSFAKNGMYEDILLVQRGGKVVDYEGRELSKNSVVKLKVDSGIEFNRKMITDMFMYQKESETKKVFAFVIPLKENADITSIIAICPMSIVDNIIDRLYDGRYHVHITDSTGAIISRGKGCSEKEGNGSDDSVIVEKSALASRWKVEVSIHQDSLYDPVMEYTDILYGEFLICVVVAAMFFALLITAQISYKKQKTSMESVLHTKITSLSDDMNEKSEIIRSISRVYTAMYIIDIADDSYEEIFSDGVIKEIMEEGGSASDRLYEMCDTYVLPEYRDELTGFIDMSTLPERLAGHDVISFEYQYDEGEWQRASFIRFRESDKLEYVLYVVKEIGDSKIKELEYHDLMVKAMDEAKRANVAKSAFLSRMSHDIRTPINGIMGMIDIARKNMNDAEKAEECFKKITSAANHLLTIVSDMLNMSKLENGEIELEEEKVNLKELLLECIEDTKDMARSSGVEIKKHIINLEHKYVIGSPLHLRQVFMNVINNAVRYNEQDGMVKIELKEIKNEGQAGEATYQFVVTDTGIGMSPEFVKVLFEPFSQEHQSARTTYQGSGLGMSIVKGIVDKLGGFISVDSKEGIGTIISIEITMPVSEHYDNEEEEEREKDAGNHSGRKKSISEAKILIVEDNMLNMEIAKYMLEEVGATILTAENGKEGVEAFINSAPYEIDLILMDIMMPIMDGIEATKVIRQLDREDAGTVSILAMTANAFAEDVVAVKKAGMDGHIPKPIVIDKFYDLINSYI